MANWVSMAGERVGGCGWLKRLVGGWLKGWLVERVAG